ncbi:indole-3-glycerol phosphate synthase TrpC [Mesobacillus subterraneus]|uniref:Indole-3-glycerol phosphate synthase n=1 Tax=Mesobacillus subterraneus TaxID=285983 RepID=A0A427TP92_9BACI|nr:indole-3-glycerol phosphate synthase TrpC [Mesobacillus subterraneus]RSD26200.1 indole-3-glycerol phosphate synthase TrpC [Mesobacillus subterraneus]
MMTILDSIIERKKAEVQVLKKSGATFPAGEFQARSLITALQRAENVAIIAEFKRASPSKGIINQNLNPVQQAKLYESAGASAISVLTDEEGFKGSFADLKKVREAVGIPILCKDFIIDEIQIDAAHAAGADLILLIASVLSLNELTKLYDYASTKGLECLVEVHDKQDLEKALKINASLIGINNRDLKSFKVDLSITEKLGAIAKSTGAFLISESGLSSRADILRVAESGADGVLIGESFMTSSNLSQTFAEFTVPSLRMQK